MALSDCRRPQRLFSRRCERWVPFSSATIEEIRGYDDLWQATQKEAAFLHVSELSCDQCAATLPTLTRSNAENGIGDV